MSRPALKVSEPIIEQSIQKFENFIENVLKENLKRFEKELAVVNEGLMDYIQQRHTIRVLCDKVAHQYGFTAQVDIGSNFCIDGVVHDTSKMLINIGKNCYLEYTLPEATRFLSLIIGAYEMKVREVNDKIVDTKAHIKMVLMGINALLNKEA